MVQTATLHVKLNADVDQQLKKLARLRNLSKGQLVREAISACYQTTLADLPVHQRQAIHAYEGGFISLGKLSQVMGMHTLELRHWLQEHEIAQRSTYNELDVDHA